MRETRVQELNRRVKVRATFLAKVVFGTRYVNVTVNVIWLILVILIIDLLNDTGNVSGIIKKNYRFNIYRDLGKSIFEFCSVY